MEHDYNDQACWYVAHTYSGYENKVKASIEATVENRNMEDQILQVEVPIQQVVELKNGKRTVRDKKLFPGYVIIKMFMTDESWYVVRNTRGVTGFVGPGSKPIPLSDEELASMGIKQEKMMLDLSLGENVEIIDGPMVGFNGIVESINEEKGKVRIKVNMFGRETSTELDFEQIEKITNT